MPESSLSLRKNITTYKRSEISTNKSCFYLGTIGFFWQKIVRIFLLSTRNNQRKIGQKLLCHKFMKIELLQSILLPWDGVSFFPPEDNEIVQVLCLLGGRDKNKVGWSQVIGSLFCHSLVRPSLGWIVTKKKKKKKKKTHLCDQRRVDHIHM